MLICFSPAARQPSWQVAAKNQPLESARVFIAVASVAFILFQGPKVGRCTFTLSKPVLKAPMVSALESII